MIIVRTPQALREALYSSVCPAFVPTMGNLHEGHMKLVRVAREQGDCSVADLSLIDCPNELVLTEFERWMRGAGYNLEA